MQITDTFFRVRQIVGDKNSNPPIPAIIPVSRSGWWQGVKDGRYPAPIKLSPRVTVWRRSDIEALVKRLETEGKNQPAEVNNA